MRGGRRGGLWSEEEIASSGTGSERAQGRERSLRGPLREPGAPESGNRSWEHDRCAWYRGPLGDAGGRRGGLWSEEEIASSGIGSERAQGRERSLRGPLREPGARDPALPPGRTTAAHAGGGERVLRRPCS